MRRYERPVYIVLIMAMAALAFGPTLLAQSEQSIWRIAEQDENRIVLQRDAVIVDPTETVEPEPTATSEPAHTATVEADPTATPIVDEPDAAWHAPTEHEHGHAPPQWAEDWSMEKFGHGVIYGGDEATPNENDTKHNAYKGQIVPSKAGGEAYVRFHAQSNPMGRMAQNHSYELYYRDTAGNVSFLQGWKNCGDPGTARYPRIDGDPGIRPAMLVVDQASWDAGIRFEQWYCHGMGSAPLDIAVSIGESSTLFVEGEHLGDPMNPDTWIPTGSKGTNRLVDFFIVESWLQGRSGAFCLTVRGEAIGCGEDGALAQYIAPTLYDDMRSEFGVERISGNRQVDFGSSGIELPN